MFAAPAALPSMATAIELPVLLSGSLSALRDLVGATFKTRVCNPSRLLGPNGACFPRALRAP